jgi:hypothetical protein
MIREPQTVTVAFLLAFGAKFADNYYHVDYRAQRDYRAKTVQTHDASN